MQAPGLIRTAVEWCGVMLLVVVALPIVAVAFFILRAAVLGVAALALAFLAAGCCVSPGIRQRAREALGLLDGSAVEPR